jgi:hypothetical protein
MPPIHNGRPGTHVPFSPTQTHAYQTGTQTPPSSQYLQAPDGSFIAPPGQAAGPNHQNGFYQDATEAMSALPGHSQIFPSGYQQAGQAGFPGTPVQGGYSTGHLGPQAQPFQTGHFSSSMQVPPQFARQHYGTPGLTPPPTRQSGGTAIVVVCVCLALILVSAIGITAFLTARNQSQSPNTQAVSPTAVTTPSATTAATAEPTPSPTTAPSPTPTLTPTAPASPTAAPTPPPDPGFVWCGDVCTPYGFSEQYPNGWQAGPAANSAGIQFTNPTQPDQYASFKAPGQTSSSAGDLLAGDLQTNFSTKPGYVPPSATSTTTISGETWATAVAYYTNDAQQRERVQVFSTVHQGKAFIIELQALDTQFDAVNAQFFNPMLGKFQFLPTT